MDRVYETIWNAWNSPDRALRLHRVVEEMAEQGITLPQFDDALGRLLDEIRDENADEQTEDILIDVSSRLHGWCHPDQRIKTRESVTTNGTQSKPVVGTVS